MELTNSEVINLWWHYEEIAMHFNELIIQYRLQVMAGAGVIGTVSSYIVAEKIKNPADKHKVRAIISLMLLTLIISAAFLDLAYYNELLRGSVKALIRFENSYDFLYMSSEISSEFKFFKFYIPSYVIVGLVYSIIILPLLLFTNRSWKLYKEDEFKIKK